MADISDLYPKPPAPGQNALISDPAKAIGMLSALQDYRLRGQQFDALAQQPQAALTGQNIANQSSQMKQNEDASQIAAHYFGSLPDDAKPDDVYRMKMAIRAVHPNINGETINTVADVALRDPKGLRNGIATLRTMGISPEAMVSRVQGPPSATGAPTSQPMTSAIRSGTQETGLAPGETELTAAPAERAGRLQSTATTSPQYHADLENLRQISTGAATGPTADVEKKLNQLSQRFGFGATMTPDQLAKTEEFDKIANQISLNQSTMFHGSDAGLHTVVGANPSTSMSRYGREGVIDMLQGNQDAIDTTRRLWLQARANGAKAGDFDLFAERVGQEIDPRVFQFNRLKRDNQQKFLSELSPSDLKAFEEKYKAAISKKWVAPLKPVNE